jgi:hypothetical protein
VLDHRFRAGADTAQRQAQRLGVPFDVFETSNIAVAALYETSLALIRPDQHIAWRGQAVPDNLLARVTGH